MHTFLKCLICTQVEFCLYYAKAFKSLDSYEMTFDNLLMPKKRLFQIVLKYLIIFSGWLLNNPLFPPPFGHSSSSSSPKLKNKTKDGSSFTSGGQYLNFYSLATDV